MASIFCRQYRELFCQDTGAGVLTLAFLDTVPPPEFLILGFVYRLAEEKNKGGGDMGTRIKIIHRRVDSSKDLPEMENQVNKFLKGKKNCKIYAYAHLGLSVIVIEYEVPD